MGADQKPAGNSPSLDSSGCQLAAPLLILLCLLVGCGQNQDVGNTSAKSPLEAMEEAIAAGDWQTAWSYSNSVLVAHPRDPKVLAQVARVAFANDQRDTSASLMVEAARADSYHDPGLVKQAMISMITVGRLVEGLELLSAAVEVHPQQYELRRWLFDFLSALEQRDAAVPHGRALVRQRRFDFALLLQLSNTEQRELEDDSTDQIASRNPSDKRPLLAKARVHFDNGKLAQSESILREILVSHPKFLPALVLLGQVLVESGQTDQLESWHQQLVGNYRDVWAYWMVIGDWARDRGNASESARAYWESTKRNPDVVQVWSKLNLALRQSESSASIVTEDVFEGMRQRITLLSRFYAQKDRFIRSGNRSKEIVMEMVKTLRDLGRLWEAEAWAAMAMTLPGDSTRIAALRDSVISLLEAETPWQVISQHPELQNLELSDLPMMSMSSLVGPRVTNTMQMNVPSITPDLMNEAAERGLDFFGRTRDDLDQPGVPIYAELGCGGGAIDFDLDGWSDLYLLAAGGTPPARDSAPNSLRRNIGGRFVDATSPSATGDRGFGQGVAVGDLNADGFPDLLVLNYGVNRMLINNGDGSFTDVSEQMFAESKSQWSTSAAIADLNEDGFSDIVVLNYCAGLDPVTKLCSDAKTGSAESCAPVQFPAEADVFLKGTADGSFVDATELWRVAPGILGRGLGITVGALDSDPGLDVYIANDMTSNHYYSRPAGDRFQLDESAMLRGLAYDDRSSPQASMGIATSDLDRDGDIDFFLTHFQNEYHTYYQQQAGGVWQDKTAQQQLASVTLPMVGFGTEAIDFDNDGILELVVANGHVHFPTEEGESNYYQRMQIFRRNTSTLFEEISGFAGNDYLTSLHAGRALWTVDVDRNGGTDFVVTHQTEPVALMMNHTQTGNHWITLHLRGRTCARDAIGAIVQASAGNQTYTATLTSGDGYLCSNERVIRFGIGKEDSELSVTVRWPDGNTQTWKDITVDNEWLIVEGDEPFPLAKPRISD